jgi:hypothetical protein
MVVHGHPLPEVGNAGVFDRGPIEYSLNNLPERWELSLVAGPKTKDQSDDWDSGVQLLGSHLLSKEDA